jgi:DNA-binding NarL/FixJ family response regulator
MEACAWAMLVARPGPLRDSLRELISAIPLTHTLVVEDALNDLRDCHPSLVVVDFDAADPGIWRLLDVISHRRPAVRHVFMVETVEQQRLALSLGAKVALLKGFPASRLHGVIKGLLTRTEDERSRYPLQELA